MIKTLDDDEHLKKHDGVKDIVRLQKFKFEDGDSGASDLGAAGSCANKCSKLLLDRTHVCALCRTELNCSELCSRSAWKLHKNTCKGCRVGDEVWLHGLSRVE
jgi:hypothetical protein